MARILVVDDSVCVRQLLRSTLAAGGHDVEEAADGISAAVLTKSTGFDLLITDMNMPKLSGLGLIRMVRSTGRCQATPIIVLTTASGEEEREQAKELGASAWMVKPFTPQSVVRTVELVLEKASA